MKAVGIAAIIASLVIPALASAEIIAPDKRQVAPRWNLPNMNGGKVQLSDYKGKVLLLNFWATWCVPCRTEIPWFSEFAKKYKAEGLEVVGISVDEKGWKVVKPYVADPGNGLSYTVLLDTIDLSKLYKIQLMPKTVLVDRDGKAAAIHNGIVEKDAFEGEIRTLLGK